MPCSITSTTSSPLRPAYSASSTFTHRDAGLRSTKRPSEEPARNVASSVVRSGSTSITCPYRPSDATTSNTILAWYAQHASLARRSLLMSTVRSRRTMEGTTSSFHSSYACKHRVYVSFASLSTSCSPYYIWLGRSRSCDVSHFCHVFEVESGNMIGNCSPASLSVIKDSKTIPLLDIGKPVVEVELVPAHSTISITPPLSSFHYHIGNVGCFSSLLHLELNGTLFSPGGYPTMNSLYTRSLGRSFTRLPGCVVSCRAEWDLICGVGGPF